MGKKVSREEINEKEIIASFLQDEPADHESLVRSAQADTEIESPPALAPTKEESRRRRGKDQDYQTLFIKESSVTARTGKMVYIRGDFHDTIQRITHVIGDHSLSLSGFIDNVLEHHFSTYSDEITRLYDAKYKGVFTKNQK